MRKKAAAHVGGCQNTEILFVNSRELSLGNVQAQTVNDILGSTDQVGHDDVSGNADLNSLTASRVRVTVLSSHMP